MGMKYRHMTWEDRMMLQHLLDLQTSKEKIAKLMGFSLSTIYREIKRNKRVITIPPAHYYWCYRYDSFFAQSKSEERRYVKPDKLDVDTKLRGYVLKKLKIGWSPKQIEGRLKLEEDMPNKVTHETIYQYIYKNWKLKYTFSKYLRRKRVDRIPRHKRRRRVIPEELLIKHRPGEIDTRESFGHWECDLMIFKRGIRTNLITLRERKTRYLITIKNNNKKAYDTAVNIIDKLRQFSSHVKSITFDQGSEFLQYKWITQKLGTDVYFCNPASPHQKGSIENVNGVIRVLLPRSVNIGLISQNKIDTIAKNINNRPMKCHGYLTSEEVFNEAISL